MTIKENTASYRLYLTEAAPREWWQILDDGIMSYLHNYHDNGRSPGDVPLQITCISYSHWVALLKRLAADKSNQGIPIYLPYLWNRKCAFYERAIS